MMDIQSSAELTRTTSFGICTSPVCVAGWTVQFILWCWPWTTQQCSPRYRLNCLIDLCGRIGLPMLELKNRLDCYQLILMN